jgi:methylated-DNA-[protein]-cysteine S-methyltransferase
MPHTIFTSPIGPLTLVAGPRGLRHLYFPGRAPVPGEMDPESSVLTAASEQLEQYFNGRRTAFDLPLDYHGTEFQNRVWRALQDIPYGATTTYGALARELGWEGAHTARAVGAAVGATPIPIVIPCHRVIGADGSLTGYGGGLERKRSLLELEAAGVGRGQLALM